MSKIKLALANEDHPRLRSALEQEYEVSALAEAGVETRALVVTAYQGAVAETLERFPKLEMVAVFGVGTDRLDLKDLNERGLVVANTPGTLDEAVAEHALALLLAASRKLVAADAFVREGEWPNALFPLARGLGGQRCGIVGLGRIGRRIAKLAEAFGMTVCYHGRAPQPDVKYEYFSDLWALANESDALILALPGGAESQGIVDSEILQALGPEGILVNIARGSVVDEEALIEALEYGDLGAAALDVFATEPYVAEGLLNLPNVVLSPHIASATEKSRQAMAEMTLANLRAHFAGYPVPGLVVS